MANAKKCDRCGDFYLDKKVSRAGYYSRGITFVGISGHTIGSIVDLCDDCQKKLARFLDGRELKEEETSDE